LESIAPDPPSAYDAAGVRATRDRLADSQAIFTRLLGISAVPVRVWEQGRRTPAPGARRLVDEVNHDPTHWRAMIRRAS
jgi:DNA-binding transcriptional regulator YiaG